MAINLSAGICREVVRFVIVRRAAGDLALYGCVMRLWKGVMFITGSVIFEVLWLVVLLLLQ